MVLMVAFNLALVVESSKDFFFLKYKNKKQKILA
jgi:hypothetical protein